MRLPKILTPSEDPTTVANTISWKDMIHTMTNQPVPSLPPIKLPPDTDTRPFLVKVTDGKPLVNYALTTVGDRSTYGLLSLVGMGVGSKVELFMECVKKADGSPLIEQGQKIYGYAYGTDKYPLFYTPINDTGKNRYGIYWFNGNGIFEGKFQLPVYVWDGRIFSGFVRMFDAPIRHPEDYGFLGDRAPDFTIDELFSKHYIATSTESEI